MRAVDALRPACLVLLVALSGCTRPPLKPVVVVPAGPTATERLAAADRLVRAGCLDCLLDAYRGYQSLRSVSPAGHAATMGAIRAAGLIALRQRELGMVDEGYIAAAKELASSTADLPSWIGGTLDVVDVLGISIGGVTRPATSDAELEKSRILRRNREAYSTLLRGFSEVDELAAYTWVTFMCGSIDARDATPADIFAAVSTFRDTPLLAFKEATCRGINEDRLTALATADSRFSETAYLLGLRQVGLRKLDEADVQFARAYAWHPRWPALTQSMANVAMTGEEFDQAERLYSETLAADPRASEALLGKVKALTYLGKAVEAIAAVDELLGQRWHLGDARYWRALNENQLARYDEAWSDIEAAATLLINAEVPKLAGIIAYRRQRLEISRAKFEESSRRDPRDCETMFYLGVVLGDQREWPRTADVLRAAVGCLEAAEQEALLDIETIRASADLPERQARQIARREKRIAEGRRMIATSWYNTAVAYYSLSKKDEARQFAEKVVADDQFGERAKEILTRLGR
jgi:tetratricopeptide (TPR) repeat protein